MHASWLAGEGYKRKISLYDACVTDVINSYIQCTKQLAFLTGRYEGKGPNMEECIRRASLGHTPSPANVARVMQEAVAGTMLSEEPVLHGDRETIQRKRKSTFANNSHRPGYVMESKQRQPRGRPRKINFDPATKTRDEGGAAKEVTKMLNETDLSGLVILEEEVPPTSWALRRMPMHCTRKCFGIINGKKCNNNLHSRSPGLVAPAFWSERVIRGQEMTVSQWM